ncbi:hypothetical protein BpHYR1_037979 [Brachionus plicatilis]|uniref:Uncharacterized protein n=1 Tax=Brachionus plicatilis TaxID=10195 RepID=A0A3M7QM83_BRAPC|nr:hypothetical protein BpHYR1_037979 [Brachionus plicatilis]
MGTKLAQEVTQFQASKFCLLGFIANSCSRTNSNFGKIFLSKNCSQFCAENTGVESSRSFMSASHGWTHSCIGITSVNGFHSSTSSINFGKIIWSRIF